MGKKQASIYEFSQTPFEGKKAAIYVRVSSNEFLLSRTDEKKRQKEAKEKLEKAIAAGLPAGAEAKIEIAEMVRQSVTSQKEDGIRFCQDRGWEYAIYDKDCDLSGTLGSDDRPDLKRLQEDIDAGKIHTVVVRDVRRFARNARVLKNFIHEHLKPRGVNLIGRDDNIDISTPQGRFFTSILAEIAELEVSSLKQTTMRNRELAATQGKLAHCPYAYGYRSAGRRTVEVVEREAAVVRRIFNDYAILNIPTRDIADALTAEKAPLKDGTPGIWRASRIHKILHNPRYIGKINYRDHELLNSPFPPIIEQSLWVKTEQELDRRGVTGSRTQRSKSLLTGLIKCPYCIERQKKDPTVKTNLFSMRAMGGIKYYTCQAKHQRGKTACPGVTVNKEKIESFIERFVGALAADEFLRFVNDMPDSKDVIAKEIDSLKTLIEQKEQKLADMPGRLARINMKDEFIANTVHAFEDVISELKDKLQTAESELEQLSKAEQVDALNKLKKWSKLSIQDKRKALRTVVKEMVMHKDRLEITLVARPDSPLIVAYRSYRTRRKRPEFPDVTDGLLIGEHKNRLVIRVGAEFATMDGRTIRMHVDPITSNPNREKQDREQAEWYQAHPEYEGSEEEV